MVEQLCAELHQSHESEWKFIPYELSSSGVSYGPSTDRPFAILVRPSPQHWQFVSLDLWTRASIATRKKPRVHYHRDSLASLTQDRARGPPCLLMQVLLPSEHAECEVFASAYSAATSGVVTSIEHYW